MINAGRGGNYATVGLLPVSATGTLHACICVTVVFSYDKAGSDKPDLLYFMTDFSNHVFISVCIRICTVFIWHIVNCPEFIKPAIHRLHTRNLIYTSVSRGPALVTLMYCRQQNIDIIFCSVNMHYSSLNYSRCSFLLIKQSKTKIFPVYW